jgi:hypothetical protein
MTITILGTEFRVQKTLGHLLDDCLGECHIPERLILYSDQLPPDAAAEIVLHEVIHAIDGMTATEKDQLKEAQVQRISAVLFAVLRENPHLLPEER